MNTKRESEWSGWVGEKGESVWWWCVRRGPEGNWGWPFFFVRTRAEAGAGGVERKQTNNKARAASFSLSRPPSAPSSLSLWPRLFFLLFLFNDAVFLFLFLSRGVVFGVYTRTCALSLSSLHSPPSSFPSSAFLAAYASISRLYRSVSAAAVAS